jgi:hypothetical protein
MLAPIAIAIGFAATRVAAAQPAVAGVPSGSRVRVTAWGVLRERVTTGRLASHDGYSVNLQTCATCDTTRIPWSVVDRFEVHAGGNARAFNISKGAIAVGALAGGVVAGVSARREGCRGDAILVCPVIVMFSASLGLIAGTVPGILAAIASHERWSDVPLRPGRP